MASSIYINGGFLDFMGNVYDNFMTKTVTPQMSRGGLMYVNTEVVTPTLEIENIKLLPGGFDQFTEFFNSCAACYEGFVTTVEMDDECDPALAGSWDYFGCRISGTPRLSLFEQTVTGLTLGYQRRERLNDTQVQGNPATNPAGALGAGLISP